MRIALVFALAGAALVGCTKDYSGDISDLNKEVSAIQSTLTSLQTSIQGAQSAADAAAATANTALSAAKAAATADDLKAVQTALAAAATSADLTAVDAKYAAYIPAIEAAAKAADLEALETTITAAIAATDVKVADLEKALEAYAKKADLDEAVTKLAALETNYIALEARVAALEAADKEISDLIAENKAGIEANAEAIEALQKKIEELLAQSAQLVSLDIVKPTAKAINVGYAEFKGVFEQNSKGAWVASTWEGEREVPAKGTFVSSINNGTLIFKVNPTNYALAGEDLEIINKNGDVAPFVFSDPVEYTFHTSAKAGAGFYASKFSTISDLDEDALDEYKDKFEGEDVALTAHNVVSGFNRKVNFRKTEKGNFAEFEFDCYALDNDGDEDGGIVDINAEMPETITVVPIENEFALYDAYICGIDNPTTKADSIKFGLSFDGMTFSYDAEAVKKAIKSLTGKDEEKELSFTVKIAQINNCGYVNKTAKAAVTFKQYEAKPQEAEEHEDFVLGAAVSYQAKAFKSGATWGEKVTVDITEALKEWGLDKKDSDARVLWEDEYKGATVEGVYKYANTDEDRELVEVESDLFASASFNSTPDKTTKAQNLTIKFTPSYGTANATFDPIAKSDTAYVKVALKSTSDNYYVVVPVAIKAIVPTEYFTWNGTNNYADGVLTIFGTATNGWDSFDLGKAFKLNPGYDNTVVKLNKQSFTDKNKAEVCVNGQDQSAFDKWCEDNPTVEEGDQDYIQGVLSSLKPAKELVRMSGNEYRYDTGNKNHGFYKRNGYSDNITISWNTEDNVNLGKVLNVTGMSVSIYNRTFALGALNFKIFAKGLTFSTDPATIEIKHNQTVHLFNAALPQFARATDKINFAGSFSLTYDGEDMEFFKPTSATDMKHAVSVALEIMNEEGEYQNADTIEGIDRIDFEQYETGRKETDRAWGIRIVANDDVKSTAGVTKKVRLTVTGVNENEFVRSLSSNTTLNEIVVEWNIVIKY